MHESGFKLKLPNGKVWGVAGAAGWTAIKTVKFNTPHVLIPIDELDGMTPDEIGKNVLSILEQARFCQAQDFVETILSDPGLDYISSDEKYMPQFISVSKPYLNEFKGTDSKIDQCIFLIKQYEEKQKNNEKVKAHKLEQRKLITANYAPLFIKLGRKYGFKCLCCASDESLELDHIKPVSIGGTGEIDNLQLLCKKCNMEKGVQEIDYRPNESKL